MILAITSDQFWQLANILGLVVVIAVAALLTILVVLVRRIEERVGMVRETLKAAVANTARRPAHRRDRETGRRSAQ